MVHSSGVIKGFHGHLVSLPCFILLLKSQIVIMSYAPTPYGRAALEAWLVTPEKYPRNLRTALLARIYLALRRDPALAVQLIDAQRQLLADWLVRERDRACEDEVVTLVHRFRAAQVEAMLIALDDLHRLAWARTPAPAQPASAS